jgi:hypothetical protein
VELERATWPGRFLPDPTSAYLVWRYQTTLLESSSPTNQDRPNEAVIPWAYVRNDTTRDDQTTNIYFTDKPGSQKDLSSPGPGSEVCNDPGIRDQDAGFPPPTGLKRYLHKLGVGESGYDDWCYEYPPGQEENLVVESSTWQAKPGSSPIVYYFTGNPR